MAKVPKDGSQSTGSAPAGTPATVEYYAYTLIEKYYHRLVSREALVLKDKDPEDLHQMRVAIRRLQTALQIFDAAIVLPKAAQIKSLQRITKRLGKLRDLDVQLDTLETNYAAKLDSSEHSLLQRAIAVLAKQRKRVFSQVKVVLKSEIYQDLKTAYEGWLAQPCYTPSAQQALGLVLPELMGPLLSALLLHPGWLLEADDPAAIASSTLHDLRKTCKHVRYQAEFFTDFYDPAFEEWIQEIKGLQDSLGQAHDMQVLQQILIQSVPEWEESIHLRQMIAEQQEAALGLWRSVQAKYLSPDYRLFLHQLLLSPLLSLQADPETVGNRMNGGMIAAPSDHESGMSLTQEPPSKTGKIRWPAARTAPKPTTRTARSRRSSSPPTADRPPADGPVSPS